MLHICEHLILFSIQRLMHSRSHNILLTQKTRHFSRAWCSRLLQVDAVNVLPIPYTLNQGIIKHQGEVAKQMFFKYNASHSTNVIQNAVQYTMTLTNATFFLQIFGVWVGNRVGHECNPNLWQPKSIAQSECLKHINSSMKNKALTRERQQQKVGLVSHWKKNLHSKVPHLLWPFPVLLCLIMISARGEKTATI